jgi:hypothetical protein
LGEAEELLRRHLARGVVVKRLHQLDLVEEGVVVGGLRVASCQL